MSTEISELEGAKEVAEERLAVSEGDLRELKDELSQVWFRSSKKRTILSRMCTCRCCHEMLAKPSTILPLNFGPFASGSIRAATSRGGGRGEGEEETKG
jgi:hypothetical protein